MKIVDAHSHLWLKQNTTWNGLPIKSKRNGRSIFLGEDICKLRSCFVNCYFEI